MRQRMRWSSVGAFAPLAALLMVLSIPAAAGESGANSDPNPGASAPCGSRGEGCARISGYIRAGAEFPDAKAKGTARFFARSPLFGGAGGPDGADPGAPGAAKGFLKVSGDADAR